MASLQETIRVGKHGRCVIPAGLLQRFEISEGSLVIAEECPEGIFIRPTSKQPIEVYSYKRKAEFLLFNAVSAKDYAFAKRAVRKMGLNPDKIRN